MWIRPSENGIGDRRRLTVIYLRRTEESGETEEDSSDRMRTGEDLDLPPVDELVRRYMVQCTTQNKTKPEGAQQYERCYCNKAR